MKTQPQLVIALACCISFSVATAQPVTQPITAASFPKEVIPHEAGQIEFFARLLGFSGTISVGGQTPHFFQISDGQSTFHMGFNANDGAGNGGCVGVAGYNFFTGTGFFGSWSYEDVFGASEVNKWHKIVFKWNKDGLPEVDGEKMAIYIDGVLNSGRWSALYDQTFPPLTDGTFNLITTGNPAELSGWIGMDEIKIFDGDGNLILANGLGSEEEIENSETGPDGTFNGFGGAKFVKGFKGNALAAHPVSGVASPPMHLGESGSAIYDGESKNEIVFQISPVPSAGLVSLELLPAHAGNLQIHVYDLNGKRVVAREEKVAEHEIATFILDLNQLTPGMFLLELINEGKMSRQKLVIEK